jgi:hypothetical protein
VARPVEYKEPEITDFAQAREVLASIMQKRMIMWTVILILATGTQNVGQYSTAQACETAALKFQQQKVVAACTRNT